MSEKVKVKKPFYKKWWVWLIAIILLIAIVNPSEDIADDDALNDSKKVAATDSTEKVNADKAEEKKKAKEKPEKETKQKEEPKTYSVGDSVDVGKMTYIINSVETTNQVGPELLNQKASGKYVILDITLKNNGNDAVTVDSSFFKLKRGEKTYEADTMATMYASQDTNSSFFLEKVNPDSQITGKVVFDVAPEVADSEELQAQVQTGVWGTETGMINLK